MHWSKGIALLFVFSHVAYATGGAPPVQSAIHGGASGTDCTCAFAGNTTANNTIVIAVGANSTTWTTAVLSDSCGDTFTEAANSPVTASGSRMRVYTARTSGGCSTMACTLSASLAQNTFCAEYNNMAATGLVDCTSNGTGTGTALATGACSTTSLIDTLVSFGYQPASGATYTAGSGYTIERQNNGTNHSGAGEDKNVSSIGNYTGTITSDTSAEWVIHVMALRNATQPIISNGLNINGGKLNINGGSLAVRE